jgi:RHS repeat-associated protein
LNYRFVYHGDDVVAEYVDKPGSAFDYKRIYWLMPDIDERIGFIHIDNSDNKEVYYYITDHQGSVLQVVDDAGNVINQYDYDAFGNIIWENSYEGIENRYKFQGREYDSHAGHYYYRYRTYIPEWGSFTGPDMNLSNGILGEPNGIGNYLFCNNNPVDFRDPRGLKWYESYGTKAKGDWHVNEEAGVPEVSRWKRDKLKWGKLGPYWTGKKVWQKADKDELSWYFNKTKEGWATVSSSVAKERRTQFILGTLEKSADQFVAGSLIYMGTMFTIPAIPVVSSASSPAVASAKTVIVAKGTEAIAYGSAKTTIAMAEIGATATTLAYYGQRGLLTTWELLVKGYNLSSQAGYNANLYGYYYYDKIVVNSLIGNFSLGIAKYGTHIRHPFTLISQVLLANI